MQRCVPPPGIQGICENFLTEVLQENNHCLPVIAMSHDVCTGLYFLDRDSLYERERVYELDYDPGNGFPTTNMKLTKFDDLNIQDVRGRKDDLSFDAQGFAIMELDTTMSIEDFEDPNKVEEVYLKEVCEKLLRLLGASRVQVFDQLVR